MKGRRGSAVQVEEQKKNGLSLRKRPNPEAEHQNVVALVGADESTLVREERVWLEERLAVGWESTKVIDNDSLAGDDEYDHLLEMKSVGKVLTALNGKGNSGKSKKESVAARSLFGDEELAQMEPSEQAIADADESQLSLLRLQRDPSFLELLHPSYRDIEVQPNEVTKQKIRKRSGAVIEVEVTRKAKMYANQLDSGIIDAMESSARGPRILLVDDNLTNRMVGSRMLQLLGCQFDVAEDGREAVRLAMERDYAVIFMDCDMPKMNGYDATREIRRREGYDRQAPRIIVALTSDASFENESLCISCGMDRFVAKPYLLETLKREIFFKEFSAEVYDGVPLFSTFVISSIRTNARGFLSVSEGEIVGLLRHASNGESRSVMVRKGDEVGKVPMSALCLDDHCCNLYLIVPEVLLNHPTWLAYIIDRIPECAPYLLVHLVPLFAARNMLSKALCSVFSIDGCDTRPARVMISAVLAQPGPIEFRDSFVTFVESKATSSKSLDTIALSCLTYLSEISERAPPELILLMKCLNPGQGSDILMSFIAAAFKDKESCLFGCIRKEICSVFGKIVALATPFLRVNYSLVGPGALLFAFASRNVCDEISRAAAASLMETLGMPPSITDFLNDQCVPMAGRIAELQEHGRQWKQKI